MAKNLIGLLIREGQVTLLKNEPWYKSIHDGIFSKTPEEHTKLNTIRTNHKNELRRAKLNPAKSMNTISPKLLLK